MASEKGVIVLPAVGTFTQVLFDTNITADSKFGYEITGFKAFFKSRDASGMEVPESNRLDCILSTKATTVTVPSDNDEIARVSCGLSFSTAAGFEEINLEKAAVILEPRLTVQPNLYISAVGSTTIGSITDVYFEFSYNIVKLSDIELLRLLVGGV